MWWAELPQHLWLLSAGKELPPEVEMSIPGLDWGVDEVMGKETKKVPQKKVPYAKPIPAQFQQVRQHDGDPPGVGGWTLEVTSPVSRLLSPVCRPGRRTRCP